MIVLTNTLSQTLQPGEAVTFNDVTLHTGCAEFFRQNSGTVGLKACGIYEVDFSANVGGAVASSPVELTIEIGGSPLLETEMISTPTVATTEFNNISSGTYVATANGVSNAITVSNTGVNPIIIAPNPQLRVRRVG